VNAKPVAACLALLLALACSVASAPHELTVSALTFSPSPGKARIYVYRPSRLFASAARLKVAIDSQIVGKAASGTFMMVEVDPGTHRISGLTSESDRGVLLEAMADSSYFFKLWPRAGFMSAQSGIEPVDPAVGRREVQKSRMVLATWPPAPPTPTATPKN
jgi:hypothetical protein